MVAEDAVGGGAVVNVDIATGKGLADTEGHAVATVRVAVVQADPRLSLRSQSFENHLGRFIKIGGSNGSEFQPLLLTGSGSS